MPFPALLKEEMTGIETAFQEALARQQINVDNIACPRGSDQSAVHELIRHASNYNRENGNTIVPFAWMPAASVAGQLKLTRFRGVLGCSRGYGAGSTSCS